MPDPAHAPLHTMSPTTRFADRADDYRRFRPSYPAAAIEAVLDGLGEPSRIAAADIGAGTGISSRLLAERGVRVIAVEPNEAMRAAAEAHPNVEWRGGTAERTGLGESSVDLVVCAQAFHWFEPAAALEEFRRILRPRGRLALVWNSRDNRDAFTRGYIEAIRACGGDHPAEQRPFDENVVSVAGLFTPPRLCEFPYAQELTADALIGRAMSASYVPKEGEGRERLERMLRELHARHTDANGVVRLVYRTLVYVAERG